MLKIKYKSDFLLFVTARDSFFVFVFLMLSFLLVCLSKIQNVQIEPIGEIHRFINPILIFFFLKKEEIHYEKEE